MSDRLEAEELTLPLAELLLEKMQIVQINEKDLIDTIMLLREHPVGDMDEGTINASGHRPHACQRLGLLAHGDRRT